jgi:hypothetical protein
MDHSIYSLPNAHHFIVGRVAALHGISAADVGDALVRHARRNDLARRTQSLQAQGTASFTFEPFTAGGNQQVSTPGVNPWQPWPGLE